MLVRGKEMEEGRRKRFRLGRSGGRKYQFHSPRATRTFLVWEQDGVLIIMTSSTATPF